MIAGGGPAALEAALALQGLAQDRVAISLVAPEPEFQLRSLAVGELFGEMAPRVYSMSAIAAERGFELVRDIVVAVQAGAHRVTRGSGATMLYDALVLGIGARPVEAVPGAVTFRGASDVPLVRRLLADALKRPAPRVAFVAAPATAWTLPVYEMALLSVKWARMRGAAIEPWVVTHESRPLELFGAQAIGDVTVLLDDAGVRLWTGAEAEVVEDGRLWLAMEGGLPVELVLALPVPAGHAVTGLPHDEQGFTPVDRFGRVPGAPDVYAVGDMTTRPLKQGGLAAGQADATASAIAAWAGADVEPVPYRPELRAALVTGGAPLYLHRPPADMWPAYKVAAPYLGAYLTAHPELEIALSAAEHAG